LKDDIQPRDWVVLELANFQLIDLKYSPHIAVCLMVVPEHLDWHVDTEEYYNAKTQLFRHQSSDDIAIYNDLNQASTRIASTSKGWKVPYMNFPGGTVVDDKIMIDDQAICEVRELKLLGRHNWENVCAALTAVWKITQDVEAIRSVLTSFSGLPFRIELRREVNQVRYYNDSFATAPGAAVAAFKAVLGPKVMIIGGYDRGLDLSELPEAFKTTPAELRKVLLIGATARRTAAVFDEHGFSNYVLSEAKDMTTVVQEATRLAQHGDAVVLSPGFASFDMFKSFEDRGRQFNDAVAAL
jgi:UDP-N-acetylmuramoylalanine--D-glutamate ligase